MPSYRERREAGEFAAKKSEVKAVREAQAETAEDAQDDEALTETPIPTPTPKQKKSGVKVTDAE